MALLSGYIKMLLRKLIFLEIDIIKVENKCSKCIPLCWKTIECENFNSIGPVSSKYWFASDFTVSNWIYDSPSIMLLRYSLNRSFETTHYVNLRGLISLKYVVFEWKVQFRKSTLQNISQWQQYMNIWFHEIFHSR